jgi:hypothetical protein
VLSKRQRPKIDEYPDYLLVVLHFPFYDKAVQRLNATELDVFRAQATPKRPVASKFSPTLSSRRSIRSARRASLSPVVLRAQRSAQARGQSPIGAWAYARSYWGVGRVAPTQCFPRAVFPGVPLHRMGREKRHRSSTKLNEAQTNLAEAGA